MEGAPFELCAKFKIKTNSDWSKQLFPMFPLAETNSKQIKERQIQIRHLAFIASQKIKENRIFKAKLIVNSEREK